MYCKIKSRNKNHVMFYGIFSVKYISLFWILNSFVYKHNIFIMIQSKYNNMHYHYTHMKNTIYLKQTVYIIFN